ncbi:MAG: nuclease [Stygiobacter sp.]|nr:MAG: nuclease [Stygiobacter sp.]
MGRLNWYALVRQIKNRRAGSALFFKPVCVIAAVDLADEGRITPNNIDAHAVIERFSDYITPFYPDRGKDGYKPLWHLTNDRFWTFFKGEEAVEANDFLRGAPATKAKLFATFNRLAIHEDLVELWNSPQERRTLRDFMLLILNESDTDSRRLIAPLFNAKHLLNRDLWPNDKVLNAYFRNLHDQLNLFEEDSLEAWPRNDLSPNPSPNADQNPLLSLPPAPEAIENVPSPISYVWSGGRIVVSQNSVNLPVFPYALAEHDHAQRLEACAVQAQDLIRDLSCRRWQVRKDYEIEIKRYLERLPVGIGSGNILLADAAARTLREMFAAEHEILPAPFAARLKTMLQQHIAIRPFYPEIEDFYRAVQTGRIDASLPLDAVSDVISVVRAQTPTVFDESVTNAIGEVSSPKPQITAVGQDVNGNDAISPPPDPLGELDPTKARDFQTAGWINGLWKVFKTGATVRDTTEAWIATYHSLSDPIKQILTWLNQFLNR